MYQTVNEIRQRFLNYFTDKGHYLLPSFPLVPQGDKSLLLINSGMAPMKAFFTGAEKPPSKRVVTCQKCIRTVDIDDVGKDARHGSFFEMLGNFSFGDYFKKEVIPWAWEFLTVEMNIPAEKLSISVYQEDQEAYDIWHDVIGIPAERIYKLDKDENFWEIGVGPCGPCSEIHYDRGLAFGCGSDNCTVGCDCDRWMEVWNLVFTQFSKDEDGHYTPLATTNIDTGMGLERLAIVLQEAKSIFDIDNIASVRAKVLASAGLSEDFYTLPESTQISANIMADHIRSVVFMASDGVLASNEGRGYVLRRLLRRAVRHGRAIGIEDAFIEHIAQVAIDAYGDHYPNLKEKSSHILQVLSSEEAQFLKTLDAGMGLLQKQIEAHKQQNKSVFSGTDSFKLYDTYGFPPDLTRELVNDAGLSFDENGFQSEMEAQKERARAARGETSYSGSETSVYHQLPPSIPTEFVGYDALMADSEVLAMVCGDQVVTTASEGDVVSIVLVTTPFYTAGGGQKGDVGILTKSDGLVVNITDCIKVAGDNIVHVGVVKKGTLNIGETVHAAVDAVNRTNIMRNHTATHMLQKALRIVLGDHVEQAGSEVTADRLRFDFTHIAPLTADEKAKVEKYVNDEILKNVLVSIHETTQDDARERGALAIFGEKYGEIVRVVDIGSWSVELCGGTHVKSTSELCAFKLVSENGIASGVRRIEAVTGCEAINQFREASGQMDALSALLRVKSTDVTSKVSQTLAEVKSLKKEAAKIQSEQNKAKDAGVADDLIKHAVIKNGITLVSAKLAGYDIEALRMLSDKLKASTASICLMLCGINEDDSAAMFLCSASDDAVKSGIHAGNIVKEAAGICGGGGGGRPNHAQAGGKDVRKADEAVRTALSTMQSMIN